MTFGSDLYRVRRAVMATAILLAGSISYGAVAQDMPGGPRGVEQSGAVPVKGGPGSLTGVWMNAAYKGTGGPPPRARAIQTVDGKTPPLLPAPAAVLEKRITDADKGDVYANSLTRCLPGGVPEMMFGAPYPVQILETSGQITMLFEEQNHFRIVRMNSTHPADPDPSYMGDSIGHWDGDTLVVDTVALNDKTTLDMVGTPHTEALHVIERYRRIAADRMEIGITIEDPGTFSRPWETRALYKLAPAGTHVAEYICENNRNAADANGFASFGHP